MYYFCTYFDRNYLPRGLALYHSLREHCPEFKLWVLCMDAEAYTLLSQRNLPDIHLITLEEFERDDKELLQTKQNRSAVEYYFTCTPSLPLFILKHHPEVELITYLDADLFFFADPTQLFAEMVGKSIAIIAHRFPARLRHIEVTGVYNVGWVSFRRNEIGLACLYWWRERCIEWCYDRIEGERYADQKYLDLFPEYFGPDVVIQNKGANVAPWNIENYALAIKGNNIYIDDKPLVFFHFQGLQQVISRVYDLGLWTYGVRPFRELIDHIYLPYIKILRDSQSGRPTLGTLRNRPAKVSFFMHIQAKTKWALNFLLGLFRRQFFLFPDRE